MEILDRQQLGLTILKPLRARQRLALRAVPIPATVEGDALVVTSLSAAASRGMLQTVVKPGRGPKMRYAATYCALARFCGRKRSDGSYSASARRPDSGYSERP